MSACARRVVGLPEACRLTGASQGVFLAAMGSAGDAGGGGRLGGEGPSGPGCASRGQHCQPKYCLGCQLNLRPRNF